MSSGGALLLVVVVFIGVGGDGLYVSEKTLLNKLSWLGCCWWWWWWWWWWYSDSVMFRYY